MDVDYRDTKKLARLLSDYVEQAVKLSRLYNIESGYTQSKTDVEIKRAAESLIKAHRKKHKETDVSAIQSVIKSGIKLIKDTIEMLENDSDPVQPCCSSVTGLPRQFTDMERQLLEPKWTQHNKYMNALFEHSKDAGKFLDDLLGKITSAICSQVSHHDCKTCAVFMEMGEWMIFEPLVIVKDADRTFRAYLKSGRYECSRTGLRIECSSDVQLEYLICDWEQVNDTPEMEQFTPCGPLMDLTVISGELKEVYLPHFLCLGESLLRDAVKVLHVEDSGVYFEECTLTRFHAKLLDHSFSPKGLLVRRGFTVYYHCETLIYRTLKSHLTLHVYLIPSDKQMKVAVTKKEEKMRSEFILKPEPQCKLQMNGWFTLKALDQTKTSDCNSDITPKELQLIYSTVMPRFFEVFIKDPKEEICLQLMAQQKPVWHASIRQGDYHQMTSTVDGSRETQSSCAVGNRTVSEILLEHLDELESEEMKTFTWHLTQGVKDFKISKSRLENKSRCEVVECMIDHYRTDGAAQLTLIILEKMKMNYLAKQLQEELKVKAQ